jgi:hypothetical protein
MQPVGKLWPVKVTVTQEVQVLDSKCNSPKPKILYILIVVSCGRHQHMEHGATPVHYTQQIQTFRGAITYNLGFLDPDSTLIAYDLKPKGRQQRYQHVHRNTERDQ